MNTDGNIHALNKHVDKMERDDARDKAIEAKSNEFYDAIVKCESVDTGAYLYDIDDFIGDLEINSSQFADWIGEKGERLRLDTREKLAEWCNELAAEYIDNL